MTASKIITATIHPAELSLDTVSPGLFMIVAMFYETNDNATTA
jgi:hypothetical protein